MEKEKLYNLGVVCGRFGHIHKAHALLINASLELAKKTMVLVGSAQESKTLRNPFSVQTRKKCIKSAFHNIPEENLIIQEMKDLSNEYDVNGKWGKYVKKKIEQYTGTFADLMVYGNDELRDKWFDKEDIINTTQLVVPRSKFEVSATMVRGLLLLGDRKKWEKFVPEEIYSMYDELRNELLSVPVYNEIYEKMPKKDLENFMAVYKKYEEADKKRKIDEISK